MEHISKKLIKIAQVISTQYFKQQLKQATFNKCAITIEYLTITDNKLKSYTIMPLQLKRRKKYLVLYAQDTNEENKTKSFVVQNIKNIKIDPNIKKRNRKNLLQKLF